MEGLWSKQNPFTLLVELQIGALWKTVWRFLRKLKIELPWKKKKSVSCSVVSQLFVLQSMDCNPPGSSFHGILQANILEWVANPFSRGSSWLRNQTQVSCIACRFFTVWATREVPDLAGPLLGDFQQLRLGAPNTGAWVQSLVRKLDPTCCD